MNRLRQLYKRNGLWAMALAYRLVVNRTALIWVRWMTGVPDIYFQGMPRIIGMRFIKVGRNFQCGRGAWIEAVEIEGEREGGPPRISIGNNVVASEYLHLAAIDSVSIGDDVLIGSGVLITDHAHGRYGGPHADAPSTPPCSRKVVSKGSVNIGRNVWIADGVKILSGVTIGEGSVIGANTVVSHDIPANSIYAARGVGQIVKVFDHERHEWRTPAK